MLFELRAPGFHLRPVRNLYQLPFLPHFHKLSAMHSLPVWLPMPTDLCRKAVQKWRLFRSRVCRTSLSTKPAGAHYLSFWLSSQVDCSLMPSLFLHAPPQRESFCHPKLAVRSIICTQKMFSLKAAIMESRGNLVTNSIWGCQSFYLV